MDQRAARLTAEQRHAQIDLAARALALEEGLGALTLRGIATRVGVASGLVAHYEPSMEALVAHTFAAVAATELAEVEGAVASGGTPIAQLATLVATLLDTQRDDVSSVWADAWSLGRRMHLVAAAARAGMDAWSEVARGILRSGRDSGAFPADADLDLVALQLFALVDSTTAYALVGYRTPDERRRLVTRSLEASLGLADGTLVAPAAGATSR
ncbi:hypothetical protein AX769_20570 [Frondihabitans sp. PAMC 28766]|uniref:TetR/AcrR family transcriptional regulator n=1 Tax=Frondihabitans sp. PAMC 28766 TaxID=1795630 RepID=UPI00078D0EA7|nr:TetR family transcriptional regulator C-terminal domain-containing protein [Frondihabitans sp. PAMC 28766]AMM22101.1 hypothetical protein AX769_20570 [Frondihabitans sp. PAMC 28766]